MQFVRFFLIFFSVALAALGQIILKVGMSKVGLIGFTLNQLSNAFTQPLVLAGLFLYGLSLIVWLVVLSRENLSFVYPMVAFSYLITTILAKFVLKEEVPSIRWLGLSFILFGIILVARS